MKQSHTTEDEHALAKQWVSTSFALDSEVPQMVLGPCAGRLFTLQPPSLTGAAVVSRYCFTPTDQPAAGQGLWQAICCASLLPSSLTLSIASLSASLLPVLTNVPGLLPPTAAPEPELLLAELPPAAAARAAAAAAADDVGV